VPRYTRSYPADVAELVEQLSSYGPPEVLDEQCGRPGVAHLARRARPGWALFGEVPISQLAGWTAPPDCDALVLQVGTPHVRVVRPPQIEPSAWERSDPAAAPSDLWLTVGVDRSGCWASRLHIDGEVHDGPPDGGRVPDVLLRCFERPTAPPAESTAGVLAVLWLLGILQLSERMGRRLTWTLAVRAHLVPAIILTQEPDLSHRRLVSFVREAPTLVTWDVLKLSSSMHDVCPAELAGWMDAGIYSRWVTDELPDLATLLPQARAALQPGAYSRVVNEIVTSMQAPWEGAPEPF
jgi:hypothetical protein